MLESRRFVSTDQIISFFHNGFLALDTFATADDLEEVRGLLDGLFDRFDELPKNLAFDLGGKKLHEGFQRSPQINGASGFEERLKETTVFANACVLAKELMGSECVFRFDHAIYKPSGNERETPWHQDMGYGGNVERISFNVAFWIPLQEATVESGCMQFIPHSHWGPLLPHHKIGHDPEAHTLETDGINHEHAVACPIPAGGLTAHMPKTLHYTGPNKTNIERRAWILNFAASTELGG